MHQQMGVVQHRVPGMPAGGAGMGPARPAGRKAPRHPCGAGSHCSACRSQPGPASDPPPHAGWLQGLSPLTVAGESAAGIREGGRTGLTSLTVSFYFFLSLFFAPLLASIPPYATGPVLVLVRVARLPQLPPPPLLLPQLLLGAAGDAIRPGSPGHLGVGWAWQPPHSQG